MQTQAKNMMMNLDESIQQVDSLYQQITGRAAPRHDGVYAPIPPEADPTRYVAEQVERLAALLQRSRPGRAMWIPPMTVVEEADNLVITFDLAGVPRDLVDVSITKERLTVAGNRVAEGNGGLRLAEAPRGPFRREVPLPANVAIDRVRARMRDGVLEIRLQRLSSAEAKVSITVE